MPGKLRSTSWFGDFDYAENNDTATRLMTQRSKEGPMATNRSTVIGPDLEHAAGNGILHRRMFLTAGTAAAASVAGAAMPNAAAGDALQVEPWMKIPGTGFVGYGQPSTFESKVVRTFA